MCHFTSSCLQKRKITSLEFFIYLFIHFTHRVRMHCEQWSAISEKMQMCYKPTWWGQVSYSTVWKGAGWVTYVHCCDWHSLLQLIWLTMLIMLDGSLMMMIRDLRATAWHTWRMRVARAWGCLAPHGEHLCVCNKWQSEHTHTHTSIHPQVSLHASVALLHFHLDLCQWWRGSIHSPASYIHPEC